MFTVHIILNLQRTVVAVIETRQGKDKIIGFFPTNQITLYLLH